ncbi:MAG: hypothetical protein M0Q90_17505, partial [Bacteroidales bacterium]|nr:hypothetical protein [Bacteroidales bacterium]
MQDTAVYDSQQKNISGQITVGAGWGTVSGSASKSNIEADYASVNEQSGIIAGNGGFDITVKGNTDLNGGTIVSAAPKELNSLNTGSLAITFYGSGVEFPLYDIIQIESYHKSRRQSHAKKTKNRSSRLSS